MKNTDDGKSYLFIPTVVISNMELKTISKLKKAAMDYYCIYDLEIINCVLNNDSSTNIEWEVYFVDNISIHGCNLCFQDIRNICNNLDPSHHKLHFSGNFFNFREKDWCIIEDLTRTIRIYLEACSEFCISSIDLRNCDFNEEEKKLLKEKINFCELLI